MKTFAAQKKKQGTEPPLPPRERAGSKNWTVSPQTVQFCIVLSGTYDSLIRSLPSRHKGFPPRQTVSMVSFLAVLPILDSRTLYTPILLYICLYPL